MAPTKLQIATVLGTFKPSEKTAVDFEVGVSNNDQNLFSSIDDYNNKGIGTPFVNVPLIKDGTLVRPTNSRTIYLIQNEQKRPFESGRAFQAKGYSFETSPIYVYSNEVLDQYPNGNPIK